MNKLTFIGLSALFLVTLTFFRPVFTQGRLPIPTDTLIGLFHPFRDLYAPDYPRGIPFKNAIITDPISQQIPWRQLAIEQLQKLELPLWNPYAMAGYPLLGNIQSAPFYPLNILLLFPFQLGWSLLIVFQVLLAASFMFLYLRNYKLRLEACLLGGIAFAFSGFFIAWLEWGTIVSTALWWPLVLLAIDRLTSSSKKKWWAIVMALAIATSFSAGHLQTFVYGLAVGVCYALFTFFQTKKDLKALLIPLGSFVLSLLLILPLLLPQLQLIGLSARNIDLTWQKEGWFIPWQHIVQFIAPDFFGNPGTGNYWGVWNYGEFIGYIGIVPLVFALYALVFKRDWRVMFFGALVGLSLLFAFPTLLAKIPFLLSIPFLASAQPSRLLFVVDLGLAILAAIGFDFALKEKKKLFIIPLVVLLCLLLLVSIGQLNHGDGKLISSVDWPIALRNLIVPFGLTLSVLFIFLTYRFFPKKLQHVLPYGLLALTIVDLFFVGSKYNSFSRQAYFYPPTKVLSYLREQQGIFRIMETDRRILSPNIATMYRLQAIEGYDPLYLQRYGELMVAVKRNTPDISPPFGFSRLLTLSDSSSPIIDLVGVKYVLSLNDLTSPKLQKVFQEGETRVYQNSQAFPRAFLVRSIQSVSSKEEAIKFLFDSTNNLRAIAVVEAGSQLEKTYSFGTIVIETYLANRIILQTKTTGEAFLVLTDAFYPTWEVQIDGVKGQIYRTDYHFRGVVVPQGDHRVEFNNRLL